MKTVLVVDDEFGIAEVLDAVLSEQGYEVATAANGSQALRRLDQTKADLIVLDFMMPVLDGAETLKALRAHPEYRTIPVLLMSAVAEPMVAQVCRDYSVFLRKPFRAEAFLKAIRSLIGDPDRPPLPS